MEFAKPEIQAVESTANKGEEVVTELNDLQLAAVGGGSGAISLG